MSAGLQSKGFLTLPSASEAIHRNDSWAGGGGRLSSASEAWFLQTQEAQGTLGACSGYQRWAREKEERNNHEHLRSTKYVPGTKSISYMDHPV